MILEKDQLEQFMKNYYRDLDDMQFIKDIKEEARKEEREKIKKLMHYSAYYREKILFESDLTKKDKEER